MARYDVHTDPKRQLFVDVRSDYLQALPVLVLVPLIPVQTAPKPVPGLNPVLAVATRDYRLMTQLIGSAPRTRFNGPVASLDEHWDDIIRALDILFTGF